MLVQIGEEDGQTLLAGMLAQSKAPTTQPVLEMRADSRQDLSEDAT